MDNLRNYGLIEPILSAINSGKPFLGICLGLQLLFTESEEFGKHKGLDIIKGKVIKFSFDTQHETRNTQHLKIPHMGWNDIKIERRPPALQDIADGSYFYFVHSYYVLPKDGSVVATKTSYGIDFVSSIWKDNIFACQFHPEKSQKVGQRILKNFGDMNP